MKVTVTQVYIEPDVEFLFTHTMTRWLSDRLTRAAADDVHFRELYSEEYSLYLIMSAKSGTQQNEIVGPRRYTRGKWVEYTVFVPFDLVSATSDWCSSALTFFLEGVQDVFRQLEVDSRTIARGRKRWIGRICNDDDMVESRTSG